jgi:transposase
MHPPATNLQTGARDAHQLKFAPAGVPLPETNTQGKPRNRLTMSTSLGPALHVPPDNFTEGVKMQEEPNTFAAFIGIDWADKKHDVCLVAAGAKKRERSILEHRPAAIRDWAEKLRERFGGAPIAVCLELSQGPIVSALLEYEFFVLFPVQPATLARYRSAFTTSGAKNDPTDAEYALELLLRHPDKLTQLEPESGAMRTLRRLVEARRSLVNDRVRVTNRVTAALKAYFPQVLEWFRDKEAAVFADFIERWPTLEHAQRARSGTIADFFRTHNVRSQAAIERRLEAIRTEQPLTRDAAIITPMRLVEALVPQLRAVCTAIERFDEEIARLCPSLPDYELFKALPGAGPALAPRLLVAFGERRERFPNAAALQKYAGIAPVTERSGNKSWVHWRLACPTFLRQTFVEWVAQTLTRSFWSKAFYDSCRARGMSHQAALRSLAFKWIRILYRCWIDRTPYNEPRYLMALQKRHAPLLQFVAEANH